MNLLSMTRIFFLRRLMIFKNPEDPVELMMQNNVSKIFGYENL